MDCDQEGVCCEHGRTGHAGTSLPQRWEVELLYPLHFIVWPLQRTWCTILLTACITKLSIELLGSSVKASLNLLLDLQLLTCFTILSS